MKVYLVSYDGFLGGYGIQTYLLGIYDDKDEAEETVMLFNKHHKEYEIEAYIQEVKLNYTYKPKINSAYDAISTPICLCSYLE